MSVISPCRLRHEVLTLICRLYRDAVAQDHVTRYAAAATPSIDDAYPATESARFDHSPVLSVIDL
jgi:hypothetical protein